MICIIYCMHSVLEKWLPTEMFIETTGLKLASRHAEQEQEQRQQQQQCCVASKVSMATAVVHFSTSLPSECSPLSVSLRSPWSWQRETPRKGIKLHQAFSSTHSWTNRKHAHYTKKHTQKKQMGMKRMQNAQTFIQAQLYHLSFRNNKKAKARCDSERSRDDTVSVSGMNDE